jgi:hypothetical protein
MVPYRHCVTSCPGCSTYYGPRSCASSRAQNAAIDRYDVSQATINSVCNFSEWIYQNDICSLFFSCKALAGMVTPAVHSVAVLVALAHQQNVAREDFLYFLDDNSTYLQRSCTSYSCNCYCCSSTPDEHCTYQCGKYYEAKVVVCEFSACSQICYCFWCKPQHCGVTDLLVHKPSLTNAPNPPSAGNCQAGQPRSLCANHVDIRF